MALAQYTVTGVLPIRDAQTKQDVTTGGTVTLDDTKTIISALIESGAVRPVESPKAKKD
jgi:hypothetical protein